MSVYNDGYTLNVVALSISLVFGVMSEILSTFAMFHLTKCEKNFHYNHILLRYNYILGCYFAATGTLATSICRLIMLNGPDLSNLLYYRIFQTFESLGANMFRMSFFSFMLERAIATQNSATYEKNKKFKIVGPVLAVASILISAAMSVSYNLLHAPLIVLYTIYIALDIVSFMCALILNAINQKLQVINRRTDLRLSSRYQISENIRVFKFLNKIFIIGIIIAILCIVSSLCIRIMAWEHFKVMGRILYFGLWNFYGCIGAFLVIHNCSSKRFRCFRKQYKSTEYHVPIIKNVHGKRLAINQTIDGHFKSLQEIWANNRTAKSLSNI